MSNPRIVTPETRDDDAPDATLDAVNADHPGQASTGGWRPVVGFLLTVLMFTLVGLVIAIAITIVGYLVLTLHLAFNNFALGVAALTAYGLFLAFPYAILPVIGVMVAARDRLGGTRLAEAGLIGAAVSIVWIVIAERNAPTLVAALVVISSVVASLVSWKATRWLARLG